MRGEKLRYRLSMRCRLGSSPHARGKVFYVSIYAIELRIIPACAGKRSYTDAAGKEQ